MGPDTPVELRTDGQSLLVTPLRPVDPARSRAFLEAVDQVNAAFEPLLKSLAKR